MLKTIGVFYALSMLLIFLITLYIGSKSSSYTYILMFASMAWPLAAMIMIAKSRYLRLRRHALQDNEI
ncbi:MAG: hypothetical protein AAGB10_16170 [Pseudomonadota bacterium]